MNDSIVLDQRTDGIVLGLIRTSLKWTLKGRSSRQLLRQFSFVMSLRQVTPKIALGLAEVAAKVALDDVRSRVGWIRIFNVLI